MRSLLRTMTVHSARYYLRVLRAGARAGPPNHDVAADTECELARHDIEDLGLMPMHVQRRSFAGWDLLLQDGIGAVDLLAPHQHARMSVDHPNRARFILWQRNDRRRRLGLFEQGDPSSPRPHQPCLVALPIARGNRVALVLLLASLAETQQHLRPPLVVEVDLQWHQRNALARHGAGQ